MAKVQCQYPVELIERLVLSMTNEDDWVLDPFLGTGTSVIAAIKNSRRGVGAETKNKYVAIARDRVQSAIDGTLRTRPMNKPKYDPELKDNKLAISPWNQRDEKSDQLTLLKEKKQADHENS